MNRTDKQILRAFGAQDDSGTRRVKEGRVGSGMGDPLVLLQADATTSRAYNEFPVIGARQFVWITAEVHLMFAAFVLGVPMFAVVTEAIGIFGKDARYDRLAKECTRLLLVAYSATAIWGAVLVFILATLWMKPWAYLTAVFAPSMWLYV